jgi:pimeloyl-ACP methyl ester carboxylesterase
MLGNDQMIFHADRGYHCIGHDRRGHGLSSQPWEGNEMDTHADDPAQLLESNCRRQVSTLVTGKRRYRQSGTGLTFL